MEKAHKSRRRRISKIGVKYLVAIFVLGIVSFALLSLAVGIGYAEDEVERNSLDMLTRVAVYSDYIDGDKVEKYITTKELDEYYYRIEEIMNLEYTCTPDLRYFYVIVPIKGNEVAYIWDTGAEPEKFMATEVYNPEIFPEVLKDTFKENPELKLYDYEDETYGSIASCFCPIFNGKGKPVALVGADIFVEYIDEEIAFFVKNMAIVIAVVMLLAILIFFFFIKKMMINPIKKLTLATENIVSEIESEKPLEIGVRTHDELEELSHSFERMTAELKSYINRLSLLMSEKQKLAAELDVASKIQNSMLPTLSGTFDNNEKFDLFASMVPAKEVGGDFFDFFEIDDDHIALVVADVSGKGVPAALFMAKSISIVRSVTVPGMSPADILTRVNELLLERNNEDYFVTMWMGIYDVSTGMMSCTNAGHEYPIIKHRGGEFELYKDKHGMVLGEIEGIKYKNYELSLDTGDILFVYSDGIPEATDSSNEMFGTQRTVEVLNSVSDEKDLSLLAGKLKKSINDFVREAPQFDDMTMLMFRRKI